MTQLISWTNRLANLPNYEPRFNQFAWVMFYVILALLAALVVQSLIFMKTEHESFIEAIIDSWCESFLGAALFIVGFFGIFVIGANVFANHGKTEYNTTLAQLRAEEPQIVRTTSREYPYSAVIQHDDHLIAVGFCKNKQDAANLVNNMNHNSGTLSFPQGVVTHHTEEKDTIMVINGNGATKFPSKFTLITVQPTKIALNQYLKHQIYEED